MSKPRLKLHVRILSEEQIAFGPGKAELLEAIQRTGSISQAAKSMNMSYRRAWQLVDTMNQCFQSALVETQTGGTHGGGAVVTEFGQVILKKFRAMEQQAAQALEHDFQELSSYLKSPQ
ncbi:LysR family transcriptional regulator [Acinetobacter sp. VNH17]|uniref:LysR family transcriptional regulator n=1 Tax=Acinetobacter thutiue TaxID=2998078 RepID=A0ABT7WKD4_9GAMM|nr:LysR family transcriptional regulator [Acinetobacter thutiue]MCY6410996.1 LysR family transcriptional regulator [Acinetobacter thutiue]MDN0013098.1 LysR family transcriptional regulator [Acinetobacter thutiue]